MARPGIIFFDAGGTLLEPWPSVGAVYAEMAAEFGVALDAAAAQGAFERAFARCVNEAIARGGLVFGSSEADGLRFWGEVVGGMFDQLGVRPEESEALFDRLYAEFAEARRYRLLPGALETLDALASRGWRLGLISNWDARLRGILKGLGLTERLDPIVISCEVALEKPDPRVYRHALALAGASAPEAVMIGDSLEADVRGAIAAGLRGVLLDREGHFGEAEERITSLSDLVDWADGAVTQTPS